jgi:hypothetical protein
MTGFYFFVFLFCAGCLKRSTAGRIIKSGDPKKSPDFAMGYLTDFAQVKRIDLIIPLLMRAVHGKLLQLNVQLLQNSLHFVNGRQYMY